jgi:hypothetical protein
MASIALFLVLVGGAKGVAIMRRDLKDMKGGEFFHIKYDT